MTTYCGVNTWSFNHRSFQCCGLLQLFVEADVYPTEPAVQKYNQEPDPSHGLSTMPEVMWS